MAVSLVFYRVTYVSKRDDKQHAILWVIGPLAILRWVATSNEFGLEVQKCFSQNAMPKHPLSVLLKSDVSDQEKRAFEEGVVYAINRCVDRWGKTSALLAQMGSVLV